MHDRIFAAWFASVPPEPFAPFRDAAWGVLIAGNYACGLPEDALADVVAALGRPPFLARGVGVEGADEAVSLPDLAALAAWLDEAGAAAEVTDGSGRWGAIFSRVDGFVLVGAAADCGLAPEVWTRNHADFRRDAGRSGVGFGEDGDRFVREELIPLLKAPTP